MADVGIAFVAAQNNSKGSDTGRPHDVGVAGGFHAPFSNALVHWSQFVHVVAEIGAAACIHE